MVIVFHPILAVGRDETHRMLDSCASSGTAKLALISIRIVQRRICIVNHCIVFVVYAYFFGNVFDAISHWHRDLLKDFVFVMKEKKH